MGSNEQDTLPVHAMCTDDATACGKRFVGAVPLRLEDVTCETCRGSVLFKAAVLMDNEG